MPRLALLLVLALLASIARADGLRCGNRLVVDDTTQQQVLAWCGEPASRLQRVVLRPPVIWYYGHPLRIAGGDLEVLVDIWTYNLGPLRLMRRVTFEDGLVVDIETLGYGYRE